MGIRFKILILVTDLVVNSRRVFNAIWCPCWYELVQFTFFFSGVFVVGVKRLNTIIVLGYQLCGLILLFCFSHSALLDFGICTTMILYLGVYLLTGYFVLNLIYKMSFDLYHVQLLFLGHGFL